MASDPELRPFARAHLSGGEKPKNLIPNGSFEETPRERFRDKRVARSWDNVLRGVGEASVVLDRRVKRDGAASIRAQGLGRWIGVRIVVRVPANRLYRFSFWYRTTANVPRAAYRVLGVFWDEIGTPPTPEWRRVEQTFLLRGQEGTRGRVGIELLMHHGGAPDSAVWFDDVRLEPLAPKRHKASNESLDQ
jgi:hypothetical protein